MISNYGFHANDLHNFTVDQIGIVGKRCNRCFKPRGRAPGRESPRSSHIIVQFLRKKANELYAMTGNKLQNKPLFRRSMFVPLFVIGILMVTSATSQEITVAAAADLSHPLTELATAYQQKTGQQVKVSFGSSGNLTTQIQNGAPFDIFFAADEDYPKKLIAGGLGDEASLYRYAIGRLVLWVPRSSTLEIGKQGLQSLLDPSVTKLAIANPQHAPYGRAAEAALKHEGIYDRISTKLVL